MTAAERRSITGEKRLKSVVVGMELGVDLDDLAVCYVLEKGVFQDVIEKVLDEMAIRFDDEDSDNRSGWLQEYFDIPFWSRFTEKSGQQSLVEVLRLEGVHSLPRFIQFTKSMSEFTCMNSLKIFKGTILMEIFLECVGQLSEDVLDINSILVCANKVDRKISEDYSDILQSVQSIPAKTGKRTQWIRDRLEKYVQEALQEMGHLYPSHPLKTAVELSFAVSE